MQIIGSVKKAIDILRLFTYESPELSLSEISGHIDLHKSSILRTLATLMESGMIEKERETGKYRLGLFVLELAGRVLHRYDFREQARPFLQHLADKTGEIVHLSILDGPEIVYLDKRGLEQPLTVATRIWDRHPAHCSAMGKALLSGLARDEVIEILGNGPYEKMTPHTVTDPEILLEILEWVRKDGYAVDYEEAFPGIRCVAAPIEGREGEILAAISVTVPKTRMDEERTMELCHLMKDTAGEISVRSIGNRING
jgi:IclR family transcriptional regulator, KDG regulon repressor